MALRQVKFTEPYTAIAADFSARGIRTDAPGFYDDPAFVAVEQRQTDYLNNYAKFVQDRPYDDAYLARASREIPEVVALLHQELVADGRLGACVDISITLTKALNREGFWNYQTKGGLTIDFPRTSGIGTRYFWPFDRGNFTTGHSWIVAPPFLVIDLSIKLQPHKSGKDYLPDYVLATEAKAVKASVVDVASPEARADYRARGIPELKLLARQLPHIAPFWRVFSPREILHDDVKLKYVATGVGVPATAEDQLGDWQCNGRRAGELYAEIIQPRLRTLRGAQ